MEEGRLRAIVRQAVAAELREGDLVAKVTDADVHRIAQEVLDRLEERLFPALSEPGPEPAPKARRRKQTRRYFTSG